MDFFWLDMGVAMLRHMKLSVFNWRMQERLIERSLFSLTCAYQAIRMREGDAHLILEYML